MRYLLVDGHNIIHAWPELRALHRRPTSRHTAREQLLHRLRNLQDMTGERVIAVFDGTHSRTSEEREPEGLQIFHADAGTTADTIIERLVARYAKEHEMRAATADGLIRETVASFGAHWISPDSLRRLCDDADAEIARRIERQ